MKAPGYGSISRSIPQRLMFVAAVVAFLMIGGSASSFATPLGANIILNPDAELDAGAADFTSRVVPTDWISTSNFSAVQYAAVGPSDSLRPANSAAIHGGSSYFAGGPTNAQSTASQTILFADLASSVDTGMIAFVLSGYLGGYDGQADNMRVGATFLNASNAILLTSSLGPITNGDRGGVSQLLFATTGMTAVPRGARSVTITLTSVRSAGDYNDGYADNLSLQLQEIQPSAVPEPTSIALLGLGLVGVTGRFASRRYRRP